MVTAKMKARAPNLMTADTTLAKVVSSRALTRRRLNSRQMFAAEHIAGAYGHDGCRHKGSDRDGREGEAGEPPRASTARTGLGRCCSPHRPWAA